MNTNIENEEDTAGFGFVPGLSYSGIKRYTSSEATDKEKGKEKVTIQISGMNGDASGNLGRLLALFFEKNRIEYELVDKGGEEFKPLEQASKDFTIKNRIVIKVDRPKEFPTKNMKEGKRSYGRVEMGEIGTAVWPTEMGGGRSVTLLPEEELAENKVDDLDPSVINTLKKMNFLFNKNPGTPVKEDYIREKTTLPEETIQKVKMDEVSDKSLYDMIHGLI